MAPDRDEGQDTHIGIYLPGDMPRVLNVEAAHKWKETKIAVRDPLAHALIAYRPPTSILELLDGGPEAMDKLSELVMETVESEEALWESSHKHRRGRTALARALPAHDPRLLRLRAARQDRPRLRGLEMIPEWYDHPVFYYSNPGARVRPRRGRALPARSNEVDYELEIACVIGKPGRDIPAEEANEYIAGYLIMNDWSARDTWRNFEVQTEHGPGQEQRLRQLPRPLAGHSRRAGRPREGEGTETRYNLAMAARVNGRNFPAATPTPSPTPSPQMIEWASIDVWLRPATCLARARWARAVSWNCGRRTREVG